MRGSARLHQGLQASGLRTPPQPLGRGYRTTRVSRWPALPQGSCHAGGMETEDPGNWEGRTTSNGTLRLLLDGGLDRRSGAACEAV